MLKIAPLNSKRKGLKKVPINKRRIINVSEESKCEVNTPEGPAHVGGEREI